ncbi:hypothetical protein [Winogradskyella sp. PE311]|uniref:hypothetical protein n=1 Tax=Winogradskyella sp. PE311 TaxID=3366943 RepID=UPI00397F4770
MKQNSLILALLFLAVSQICISQTKKFSVYLVFNSDNQEMNVVEKNVSDSVKIRTFSFSKDLATENFKYALSVGNNGKLSKNSSVAPKSKEAKITLYHYSYIHNDIEVSDMSSDNVINYDDFINSEFKSFNTILNRASKIFVVDLKNRQEGNSNYRAYEVKL